MGLAGVDIRYKQNGNSQGRAASSSFAYWELTYRQGSNGSRTRVRLSLEDESTLH